MRALDWIPAHDTARYTVIVRKTESLQPEVWRTYRTREEAETFAEAWLEVYHGGSVTIAENVTHAVRRKGKGD